MTNSQSLDKTLSRASFWSAIILIITVILSLFFPLDSPAGTLAERMTWYSSNLGAFVIGWTIQMIAMLALTAVFAGTAWQVRESRPLSAFVAGTALLVALMAFIIVKFIAIWSIPQMVVESSTVTANAAVAEQLFQLLNPSISFSLFTSFDYLGFWMYAVFALLVARPLFALALSAKIAALSLGIFGILYHVLFAAVMLGNVPTGDIGPYAETLGALLLIPVICMAIYFRSAMKISGG
jgi:hypothetical protein